VPRIKKVNPLYHLLINDITEREGMKKTTQENEDQYRSLFENSIDAILLTQPDGSVLAANPEACRIFGCTEEELYSIGRKGVVDTTDPRLSPALEERARTGKFKGELIFVRKDGTQFPGEVSSAIFKDQDGHEKTSMTIRDISKRKELEKELKESEGLFRIILNNILDPVFITDDEGQFTFICGNVPFLLGYSVEEIQAMGNISRVFGKVLFATEELKTKGEIRNIDCTIRTKGGGSCDYLLTVKRVSIKEGTILYVCHDITERKKAEENLTESEKRLRLLTSKLFSVVENERKRISMELHDEMGQALTAVLLNLQVLEKELPEGALSPGKERFEETRSLLDQVLQQIRDLSLSLRPSMLDDLGLLPTLRWYLNGFKQRTGLVVQLDVTGLENEINQDTATTIFRIIQEALNNIAKYAESDKVNIVLHRRGAVLLGSIEDDGKGFDIEGERSLESGQSGIGLVGMHERVAMLGGRLAIESHIGKGTRISFEIPLS
jgi:PAS domain S-box-containing protein